MSKKSDVLQAVATMHCNLFAEVNGYAIQQRIAGKSDTPTRRAIKELIAEGCMNGRLSRNNKIVHLSLTKKGWEASGISKPLWMEWAA